MTESPSSCEPFEASSNFKPSFPALSKAITGGPPATYVGADAPSMIVRSRTVGSLFLSPTVPSTEKSMVVVFECRLAAVIALRRDPGPESFRLDTVTVASPCAVDARAPVMPIGRGVDEPAEHRAISAPATSRTLSGLHIGTPSRGERPQGLPWPRREATRPRGAVSTLQSAEIGVLRLAEIDQRDVEASHSSKLGPASFAPG